MKFRVGDIVTGNIDSDHNYGIIDSHGIYEIVEVSDGDIFVKILDHDCFQSEIGNAYWVDSDDFILVYHSGVKAQAAFTTSMFD